MFGRPPERDGALIVAVGTQFPDLVDKPGSWVFGVLPSGTSVAHSVFVAVPVSLATLELTRRRDVPELGVAFGVGYLSHLAGDILYSALIGGDLALSAILWPFTSAHSAVRPLVPLVSGYFDRYLDYLLSPAGLGYVFLELSLLVLTAMVWVGDGAPGTESVVGATRRIKTLID